jgi:hypothetical protein
MITLTRSMMEDWENPNISKPLWKARWIDLTDKLETNESMKLGLFFEQEAIGASAYDNTKITLEDLPKGRGSTMSVKVERTINQIKTFKSLFDENNPLYLGYKILDVQSVLKYENNTLGCLEKNVRDIVGVNSKGEPVIIDLKLTSDTDSTFHVKSWGHNEESDFTQAEFYLDTSEKVGENIKSFIYLIFDYTKDEKVKEITVTLDENRRNSIQRRKEKTINQINEFLQLPEVLQC